MLSKPTGGVSTYSYPISFKTKIYCILSAPRLGNTANGYIYWTTSSETLSSVKLALVANNNVSIGAYHNIMVIGT